MFGRLNWKVNRKLRDKKLVDEIEYWKLIKILKKMFSKISFKKLLNVKRQK